MYEHGRWLNNTSSSRRKQRLYVYQWYGPFYEVLADRAAPLPSPTPGMVLYNSLALPRMLSGSTL